MYCFIYPMINHIYKDLVVICLEMELVSHQGWFVWRQCDGMLSFIENPE